MGIASKPHVFIKNRYVIRFKGIYKDVFKRIARTGDAGTLIKKKIIVHPFLRESLKFDNAIKYYPSDERAKDLLSNWKKPVVYKRPDAREWAKKVGREQRGRRIGISLESGWLEKEKKEFAALEKEMEGTNKEENFNIPEDLKAFYEFRIDDTEKENRLIEYLKNYPFRGNLSDRFQVFIVSNEILLRSGYDFLGLKEYLGLSSGLAMSSWNSSSCYAPRS